MRVVAWVVGCFISVSSSDPKAGGVNPIDGGGGGDNNSSIKLNNLGSRLNFFTSSGYIFIFA